MTSPTFADERLTRTQAANYIGLKPSTLEGDVSRQRFCIPFYRIGSRIFYRVSDLDRWLEQKRVVIQSMETPFTQSKQIGVSNE
jgi:hypothetical protein